VLQHNQATMHTHTAAGALGGHSGVPCMLAAVTCFCCAGLLTPGCVAWPWQVCHAQPWRHLAAQQQVRASSACVLLQVLPAKDQPGSTHSVQLRNLRSLSGPATEQRTSWCGGHVMKPLRTSLHEDSTQAVIMPILVPHEKSTAAIVIPQLRLQLQLMLLVPYPPPHSSCCVPLCSQPAAASC
jgi:hypothetical protein